MYLEDRLLLLERRMAALENAPLPERAPSDSPRSRLVLIESAVSNHLGVPLDLMRSKDRQAEVVWARQLCQALAMEFIPLNQVAIARLFAVDHGTIHYSVDAVRDRCQTEQGCRCTRDKLRAEIRSALGIPSLP
jgi:chromosomal replication initiation ATPase DnaA